MPASYHWKPPASTLAHCLAVIHPKNQDVLAKGCLACRRQKTKPSAKLPARAPHPANGVRTEQQDRQQQLPTFSPWVERDSARPNLPKSKSAQTPGKITVKIREPKKRTTPATLNPYPVQEFIRSIQTCPVSRSERPPLQHASQLPLGTPSEHFSALSRCHTSQKSGCVGRRVSSLQKTKPSANFQHEPHTRPTVCELNN